MGQINTVLFVVNRSKDGSLQLAERLSEIAQLASVSSEIAVDHPLSIDSLAHFDLCVAIGGDGTILATVESAATHNTPVMGINFGTLGFMANFSTEEAETVFPQILEGHYRLSQRRLIRCTNPSGVSVLALNDLVIKGSLSHLVRLTVRIDGEKVNDYNADGLILATPTGSTAYNLSSGGPILHPSTRALVLNPINPHTLSNRALVFDDASSLTVELEESSPQVQVIADGRQVFDLVSDFPLQASIDKNVSFPLIQHLNYSHFQVLRTKLRWSGDTPSRLK